jgi:ribose transport system permease protein
MILASRLISSGFGSWQQAQAILLLSSFTIVLGFGQGLVILIGGLDLSVGVVMTLGDPLYLARNWLRRSNKRLGGYTT